MTAMLTAVKRGYAYVVQNERGHFFSEGNYDILGAAGHRRLRRAAVDLEPAVVQRQGRHDGLLVDGRVPDGDRGAWAIRPTPR